MHGARGGLVASVAADVDVCAGVVHVVEAVLDTCGRLERRLQFLLMALWDATCAFFSYSNLRAIAVNGTWVVLRPNA